MMLLYKIDSILYKPYNFNLHYLYESIPFTPKFFILCPNSPSFSTIKLLPNYIISSIQ